jgi:hypothetical protein
MKWTLKCAISITLIQASTSLLAQQAPDHQCLILPWVQPTPFLLVLSVTPTRGGTFARYTELLITRREIRDLLAKNLVAALAKDSSCRWQLPPPDGEWSEEALFTSVFLRDKGGTSWPGTEKILLAEFWGGAAYSDGGIQTEIGPKCLSPRDGKAIWTIRRSTKVRRAVSPGGGTPEKALDDALQERVLAIVQNLLKNAQ